MVLTQIFYHECIHLSYNRSTVLRLTKLAKSYLIFTRNCAIEALSVTTMHFSDHHFLDFHVSLTERSTASIPVVSWSPTSSLVASALPTSSTFFSFEVNGDTKSQFFFGQPMSFFHQTRSILPISALT
ncbi:hypothetical protein ILYODFUR_019547 [Ilyodon furcidens]|uniref:Uncharacterized protein n=1 Tax=Ilyodon furcidens TaxID=33524 RepID=A0ABV0U6Q8_9TELE